MTGLLDKPLWKQLAGALSLIAVLVFIIVAWKLNGLSRYNAGYSRAKTERCGEAERLKPSHLQRKTHDKCPSR
ncbi:hypothetical protein [Atlantibacter hermannii]|uniref:hypothetical protein n=1 Tax=Atlantibacter hermannii TaxID=565 RepID=UPI00289A00AA|nr:hypothetical protein [Atlantibacter hermannii]